jgi:hypothetical protein
MKSANNTLTSKIVIGFGSLATLWAVASLGSALSQNNWSVSELARQYMVATGMIKPLHTLVDFYTHIKGIEYLICVAFFVAFPAFYRFLNKEQKPMPILK